MNPRLVTILGYLQWLAILSPLFFVALIVFQGDPIPCSASLVAIWISVYLLNSSDYPVGAPP